ncbi:MAG: nickel-dependent hydrogenase large subunit [Deltaproteobacteria bacterium]|nr:nickel-dependent hydrogenase large subunit [Deltaproteobacteria bacterium]
MTRKVEIYPVNRVEGDLEIAVDLEDNVVADARSVGTMYRGFENIMTGRAPLDGLVITPRICGICSTSHLHAAARALDKIYDVAVPRQATYIRNVAAMTEMLQNDIRHAFLLFMPDFTDAAYRQEPLHAEVVKRYTPLKGTSVRQAINETRDVLGIIAILGGQWPHSSFMVPGGVVSVPNINELNRCSYLLNNFKRWYERQILGCSLERWRAVQSKADLLAWLKESDAHLKSDLGLFIRFATKIGLHRTGKGHGNFISFGIPIAGGQKGGEKRFLTGGGFYADKRLFPMDQENITEDLSHSWFVENGKSKHPYNGETLPYATGSEDLKYSWAKAPRYNGKPAETGPLAEMVVAADPLFIDFLHTDGPSTFIRQLARMVRPALVIPAVQHCIATARSKPEQYYRDHGGIENQQGHGLVEAPRGALGHWVRIKDNKILSYQIITPTAWNASPRGTDDVRGPWEEALIGTRLKNPQNPLEVNHVVRSFDPCLVCTVHAIDLR